MAKAVVWRHVEYPSPPLSGWWWKAAGAKWPRSIQPQSRTLPCILPSCYNPRVFLYFSWGIFHRNKPFFAQGIVQPSSYNTRLFCIFHVASWPLGPWLPFPEKYTLLCMSDKSWVYFMPVVWLRSVYNQNFWNQTKSSLARMSGGASNQSNNR